MVEKNNIFAKNKREGVQFSDRDGQTGQTDKSSNTCTTSHGLTPQPCACFSTAIFSSVPFPFLPLQKPEWGNMDSLRGAGGGFVPLAPVERPASLRYLLEPLISSPRLHSLPFVQCFLAPRIYAQKHPADAVKHEPGPRRWGHVATAPKEPMHRQK